MVPMTEQNDLEKSDPSLFKRLTYAKEILVTLINKTNGPSKFVIEDGLTNQCKQSVVDSLMKALPSASSSTRGSNPNSA